MGRVHRTKAGIILEKILSENKHRYLWCWNGEGEGDESYPYDCACCLTWSGGTEDDFLVNSCGCICHTRIEEMASHPHVRLWLVAMKAMDELPRFFSSYDDKLAYSKEMFATHAQAAIEFYKGRPCECEFCEFVRADLTRRERENEPAKPLIDTGGNDAAPTPDVQR
jgi:hypothetical protein